MKKIDISTPKYPNTFALVDDEDYERINKYKWYPRKSGQQLYACRDIRQKKYVVRIRMTNEIMRRVDLYVDHKNHNTLDNQKNNLRLCTHQQNMMNLSPQKNTSSKYKGVTYKKDIRKWRARIGVNYKRIHLGDYKIEENAAIAYNKAAKELFGEYANLNIIKESANVG